MTHPHRDREGGIMTEIAEDMIAKSITMAFGERCPDYSKGCPCCDAWKTYDDLRALQDERDGGWQDIATAPKDGSAWFKDNDIDLWHRDQGRVANCFWRKEYHAWFARSGGRTFNMGGDEKFSHWRPLPRPPHSKDSEG